MVATFSQANSQFIESELAWFGDVLNARFMAYFPSDGDAEPSYDVTTIRPPNLPHNDSPYNKFIRSHRLGFHERLAIILAMIPHARPRLLDVFFTKNETFDRPFTEFGGEVVHGAFWPTLQTLAFVAAGDDIERRFSILEMFSTFGHPFGKTGVLSLAQSSHESGAINFGSRLVMSQSHSYQFTIGNCPAPENSAAFPAKHIHTDLDWRDLILAPETERQLDELRTWLAHGSRLLEEWGFAGKLRRGYRSLFYGPPGTGKTMAACLLGRFADRPVFRIDLSHVISKYIGETEKNLSGLFDRAQKQDWILFFDEADALFGRRTQTKDSHDRYANQEVAYLLQRIEDYDGVAILASNMRDNIDPAFMRRFESVVHFPIPSTKQRLRIWANGFSSQSKLANDVQLPTLAREHEFSGASIMNVIRDCSLAALKRGSEIITDEDIQMAIAKELRKDPRFR